MKKAVAQHDIGPLYGAVSGARHGASGRESKTCKVIITVEVNGLPTSVSAAGTTFTFQIKKAINAVTPQYYVYDTTTRQRRSRRKKGTSTVPVEEGKYIVKQDVPGDPIGGVCMVQHFLYGRQFAYEAFI